MNKAFHLHFILLFFSIMTGCASNKYQNNYNSNFTSKKVEHAQRSIIKSVDIRLQTENLTDAKTALTLKVKNTEGFIDSFYSNNDKSFTASLRIPEANLDSFISELERIGKITSKSISSHDITEELIDTTAKLNNLLALRDRYLNLLHKAEKVQDILNIEKELADVQTKIDALHGKKQAMKNHIAFSYINITVHKKRTLGPLGYLGHGIFWIIGKMFVLQ